MTITARLRTEFPGITAMITGVIDALRAYRAYNRAVEDMEALKIKNPANAWILDVAYHSMLSYSEALSIYEYLSEHPGVCKHTRFMITEFIIEMANNGHTGDMIIAYLQQIDMELDRWARDKLSMRSK